MYKEGSLPVSTTELIEGGSKEGVVLYMNWGTI